ncbi:MAG: AI-2E family transporter [Mycoplasmatota bacterium]|nr:AI-2E family transporter [Mycoplasmatota bacterium]
MFRKLFRQQKDKELDYSSLNQILSIGSKLSEIFYIIAIIAIVLLATYLIKEWGILSFIGEFLGVISPIFIGFLVAWLFDPLVKWLQNKKVPRIIGCIISYLIIFGLLLLLMYMLIPTFVDQVKDFAATIPELLKNAQDILDKVFESFSKMTDLKVSGIKAEVYAAIEKFGITLTTSIPTALLNVGKSIFSGGVTFVLGLMIGFYILYDFDKLSSGIEKVLPLKWRKNYSELGTRLNESLRSYFQGLLLIMAIVFVTQSIGLTLAGLKAPLIFALFCALTDVIPYFGPYIGAIPAVIVGFTMSPLTGLLVIIAILIVQTLENNFYQPLIMGHTMKLHPVTIMIGLLVFQHFFGIIGMIIATPTIAAFKVIFTFLDEKLNLRKRIIGEDNSNQSEN